MLDVKNVKNLFFLLVFYVMDVERNIMGVKK